MPLTEEQLDDVYTDLCYRMTEAGADAAPAILARLTLVLMHAVGDVASIRAAIDDALAGFPKLIAIERPDRAGLTARPE
ncbi:MAG: hypothetical protein AB7G13_04000 [Lautropia sp.]